jgi:membrane fusion protein (multidrug efflux system)
MADEQKQGQSQVYPAPVKDGKDKDGKEAANGNGHGQAKFPAVTPEGHDGGKYAPKEEKKEDKPEEKKPASPIRKLIIGAIVAAALIAAAIWGWSYYQYSQAHVSTDDAYVTGNLVNVSPIISGTLNTLLVEEGDKVTKGQIIARLEDSGPRAAMQQAQASYQAALSQLPQAEQNLIYQQQATDAGIRKAQAELAAQQAKTTGAQQQVILSRNQVLNQVKQAESQVEQAQAQAAQYDAQVQTARAAVNSQQQTVRTTQRAADAADAQIQGAQANYVKNKTDVARYAKLVVQEAVTQQQYDAVQAATDSSESQLNASRFQAAQAHSQINAARANVEQAAAQLKAAARAADAAHQNVEVARAGLGIARANLSQISIQQSNVVNNLGQNSSALADLSTAQAGQTQVRVRQDQIKTFEAQANSSKAALANAQVTLGEAAIPAPADGTVVKKAVNVGASLSPGQTIVTITQGDYVYVTANFKETQLRDVKPGESADVEVDSFPGRIFHGYVKSINEATGATQALLPPDNATGNFTKVVQRIPVRIELKPAGDGEDKKYASLKEIRDLRQGMSVVATIDVSSKNHKD